MNTIPHPNLNKGTWKYKDFTIELLPGNGMFKATSNTDENLHSPGAFNSLEKAKTWVDRETSKLRTKRTEYSTTCVVRTGKTYVKAHYRGLNLRTNDVRVTIDRKKDNTSNHSLFRLPDGFDEQKARYEAALKIVAEFEDYIYKGKITVPYIGSNDDVTQIQEKEKNVDKLLARFDVV